MDKKGFKTAPKKALFLDRDGVINEDARISFLKRAFLRL